MASCESLLIRSDDQLDVHTAIVPNQWQGECDCIVGPFSNHQIAEYFAGHQVDFGQFEIYAYRVFARRNAWYVAIDRQES